MSVLHDGKEAPILPEEMNPGDTDTFYVSWTDKLKGATLSSDTWTIPANFTEVSTVSDVSVTENGTTHLNSNGITVSTTETTGKWIITNNAIFSDSREISRSFYIVLDSKL